MLKLRTILKYTYGILHTYNYDLCSREWIREDGLVRFTTSAIVQLINEHRIKVVEQNFKIRLIKDGKSLSEAIQMSRLCSKIA